MKKTISIIVITIVLFANCNKNNDSESCYSNTNAQTITHNNEIREYVSYIPNSYDGTSSIPLLFNFHGFGGSASEYLEYADMRSLAESDTFVLIYPQGSCLNGSSHWNPCPSGGDNKSTADDVGFVESILNEISSQYNIDPERIYATGYSNGGMMAYGLANYKSDLIAAVGSVSGAMLDCTETSSHPMPIVHLHGTSDDVIPYNGGSDYSSVQNTLDHWITFNNTVTTPTITTDNTGGLTIEHYLYNPVSYTHLTLPTILRV